MRDNRPIYSFPDIKEPEKTTGWAKEAQIELVDHELEKAKKRTAAIKERMSPPGALGLPGLLEENRLKYGIPDGAFRSQALFDRIHVFPLDAFEGDAAEKTAGGIYKPNVTKLKDKQEGHRGVLISVGLQAADVLMSHGVELGHVVITNKNVPFANVCEVILGVPMFYLVMRDADLASSETLRTQILEGEKRVIECGDYDAYLHQIAVNEQGDWTPKKRKSAYIQDTW